MQTVWLGVVPTMAEKFQGGQLHMITGQRDMSYLGLGLDLGWG